MRKQLSFNSSKAFKDFKPRIEHGHSVRAGKRKLARPFDPQKSMHLTLRSSKARGAWSLLRGKTEKKIKSIIYIHAASSGVKIYRFANGGNHLHLLVKARSKNGFQRFLRVISGLIARAVTGATKGSPLKGKSLENGPENSCRYTPKFWDGLAYSKLVTWGKQFKATDNYIFMNELEAYGIIPPRPQARGHVQLNYFEIFEG